MKNVLNKYWPLLIIVFAWLIFISPFLFKGLIPFPSTYLADDFSPWSAYPDLFSGPVKNGAMPDIISQIYPWKTLVIEMWSAGVVPLWNPYSFSGTPLLANYQSAALTPLNILYFLFNFNTAWSIQILLQPLLAGIFMYIFVRSLKISYFGSTISSLAFMFCGFITGWMAYGTLGYAILYLPLALFSVQKFFDEKKTLYLIILAVTIPLSFFSGHFQTSIYFLLFTISFVIFKLLTEKKVKESVFASLSIFSGILISMPQLLPSMELYFESARSDMFIRMEDIPWGYLPTFLAPDFFGNPVTRNDWFGHYVEWNSYIGLIPLMLGLFALTVRSRYVIYFALISLLVILLSFQSPLLDLLVNLKIPVLSTSALSRIIVLFSFSMAVLAGFGYDRLIADIKSKKYRNVYIWLGLFLAIFLILAFLLFAKLLLPLDKAQIAFSNLRLPIALFVIFGFLISSSYFLKIKKTLIILSIAVILLVGFDVLRFATKWMPFERVDLIYPETRIGKYMESMDDNYRSYGNYGAEASIYFKKSHVEGYDPLYIGRYGEFIASIENGKFDSPERSIVNFPKKGEYSDKAFNMLGIKYFVHKLSDGRQSWVYPFWEYPVDQFTKIYGDEAYEVYENHKAFPRAFMVPNYISVNDDKEIISAIFDEEMDLKNTVVLENDLNINIGSGSAVIEKYSANEIIIKTESEDNAILFLSDPYYPGWKAYVNEEIVDIYRANYAFRAVVVPDGTSTVRFSYEPDSFKYGGIFAIFGFITIGFLSILNKRK